MNKTAIILFAHLPSFEARVKSFSGFSSQKATQKISTTLTQHFYNLTQQTTADSFLIDSYRQKGKSFGQRIANAFADVYAIGYENVICIGNDCPELELSHLQKALDFIEKGNVVLGPTHDGGAYLIGIPKQQFNYFSFIDVKWQSKNTYQQLLKLFTKDTIAQFETLFDIDSEKEFSKYQTKNNLLTILQNIVNQYKNHFLTIFSLVFIPQKPAVNNLFRGPPLLVIHP